MSFAIRARNTFNYLLLVVPILVTAVAQFYPAYNDNLSLPVSLVLTYAFPVYVTILAILIAERPFVKWAAIILAWSGVVLGLLLTIGLINYATTVLTLIILSFFSVPKE